MKEASGQISSTDVLLSVWNRFFSEEQSAGLRNSGLSVAWVGTGRSPRGALTRHRAWIATALLRLHFKTDYLFLQNWSRIAFERKSRRFAHSAKLVWAYMEFNNGLLRKSRANGIPTILDVPIGHQRTCQEVMAKEYARYGINYGSRSLERWTRAYEEAYDLADRLVVGSKFVADTLANHNIDPSKIVINPYGVDVAFWSEALQEPTKTISEKTLFVYAAAAGLRKGIQCLLEAWKQARMDDAELLICGDNFLPRHEDFDTLPQGVSFIGRQSHMQLREIYRRAHVYVLPSLFEGLARSGIEAMVAGLAPIVTYESGLTDFVTDSYNGWVVRSKDASQLAARLQDCSSNRRAILVAGQRAHETTRSLSWENYGRRCADLAKAMISHKQGV